VSISSAGSQGDLLSALPSISGDGRFVAFQSFATNLVPGDTNGRGDVFVRDRLLGTTERVSLDSSGAQGNDDSASYGLSISADGRYVVFESAATNLVPGDTGFWPDIFVRDRRLGTTERVSVDPAGLQANSWSTYSSISADGRFVAFQSYATNLVASDTNGYGDVFVRDRWMGTTVLASVDSTGSQGNRDSSLPSISADGRFVAFQSGAWNLVSGDTNGVVDMFVRDLQQGTTERVSVSSQGIQGDYATDLPADSQSHWISADGRYVAFGTSSDNLVAGDTNSSTDVFVRDRSYSTFTSLCDPGASGVHSCPCSNPPVGPGRGCDNSTGTGGAIFTASGIAFLSEDSVVFTAELETPTALSIVMQGNAGIPTGVVYGQGVRCLGGTIIRRLYVKEAFWGSITAPDFTAGDPQVTVRSAAEGDVIQPAESRWYLVHYRDPIVLGGCPASSTFNSTQTGQVTWLP
jgi:Tol biopolymer transport system component